MTNKTDDDFRLLWVGKFDFRKQLNIALATMSKLKDKSNIKLIICGSGSDDQISYYKQMAFNLGIDDNVVWKGNIENSKVKEEMRKSDIFFFTSVSEDTSTVVLEAVSCGLPVLCFDTCGMGYVINESVGQKVPLTNPRQSADDFAEKINYLYNNREYLQKLSDGCKQRQKELSWNNKAKQMVELYNKVKNERKRY